MTDYYEEGVGASLSIDGVAFPLNLHEYTMPEAAWEALETSHLGTTVKKTYKQGKLGDPGEWQFTFDYNEHEDYQEEGNHTYRLTLPLRTGESVAGYIEFTGFVTSLGGAQGQIDEHKRVTMTVKQSGAETIQAGS